MEYEAWREAVFGQPTEVKSIDFELTQEVEEPNLTNFDHIDRALVDPEIHERYSREQIGAGVTFIYTSGTSKLGNCYIEVGDDDRRVVGILKMKWLYRNYFDRYCTQPVISIGNQSNGEIDFICYMLWDVLVLMPSLSSPEVCSAGLDVMEGAMKLENDNCLVSAIHGLGHWIFDEPRARDILQKWLKRPTTSNQEVLQYATQATTGMIL